MHRLPSFSFGQGGGVLASQTTDHPSEVVRQGTHSLHSFGILRNLSFLTTVSDVPILRSSQRHIHHLKRHLECLESRRSTTSSADRHSRSRFVLKVRAVGEERTLHDSEECAVGLTVIDRRAEDKTIRFGELGRDSVAHIVVKDTTTVRFRLACTASYTATDRFVANPNDLCFETLGLKRLGNLAKRRKGVANTLIMNDKLKIQYISGAKVQQKSHIRKCMQDFFLLF